MKRLLLAICLALVGLTGNPIALAEEPQQVVEVTSNKLNIRTGAGQNYPVIYTLAKGQKLVVVNEQMSWLEVQLPPQISCWISKKFVEVKEGVGSAKDRINVRTKPDGDVIGQIAEGATVKVVDEKDKWLKIETPENLTA
ncbi:MAG: SH3 domain-containing protein, partial [Planctomycetes bacterium]|nr:SH3 domain-containing protein [Planctomycetota bacterium]